jgi:hypothetical protein
VVELFTSEGCSSCPPADEVLRDVAAEAARSGRRVYPLAFHVDYWNDLGWPDLFSTALATDRQRAYARVLGERGVYTPEMIVNGRDAFVGSESSRARRSIDAALRGREVAGVDLRAKATPEGAAVDFAVRNASAGHVLQVALVQLAAETRVRAGENAGRTLRHANVVRAFQTLSLDTSSSGHVMLAAPQATGGAAIVAFVQDPATMSIHGASATRL